MASFYISDPKQDGHEGLVQFTFVIIGLRKTQRSVNRIMEARDENKKIDFRELFNTLWLIKFQPIFGNSTFRFCPVQMNL